MKFRLIECTEEKMKIMKNQGELQLSWLGAPNYDRDDLIVRTSIILADEIEVGVIGFEIYHDISNFMTISDFEIFKLYHYQGYGKQFLIWFIQYNNKNVQINPLNNVKEFWNQVGFVELDEETMQYTINKNRG